MDDGRSSLDDSGEVCAKCGSPRLRQRIFGLPGEDMIQAVAHNPDLELGGCLLVPDAWVTRCKDCGHEETLGGGTGARHDGAGPSA